MLDKKTNFEASSKSNCMKATLFATFLTLSSAAFSQSFSIALSINSPVESGAFHYFIEGSAILEQEQVLHFQLFDPSHTSLLSEGEFAMDLSANSIPDFIYDDQTKIYSFDLGEYASPHNIIRIWVTENDVMVNELIYGE